MASIDDIKAFDHRMEPHRSTIGEERNVLKEVYREMRKAGIEPVGFKMAKRLENLKPTKRSAVLRTFRETLAALELDSQQELKLVHDADNQDEQAPAPARAKVPASMRPPSRGKTRGKGSLNRQPAA